MCKSPVRTAFELEFRRERVHRQGVGVSGRSRDTHFGPHFFRNSWKPSGHTPYRLGVLGGRPNLAPIGFPRPLQSRPIQQAPCPHLHTIPTPLKREGGRREREPQTSRERETERNLERVSGSGKRKEKGRRKERENENRREDHSHKLRPKTKVTEKFWKV